MNIMVTGAIARLRMALIFSFFNMSYLPLKHDDTPGNRCNHMKKLQDIWQRSTDKSDAPGKGHQQTVA
jgi:hypothetical protein